MAGFATVFVLLGPSATTIGGAVFRNHLLLTRVSGTLMLAMALFLAGSVVLQAPWLYQERRFHPSPSRFGPFAAPVAGAAFAFGWTPCIGPVLGSVLAVAATSGRAWEGGALLGVYSLGLGRVPRRRSRVRPPGRRVRLGEAPLSPDPGVGDLDGVLRGAARAEPSRLGHHPGATSNGRDRVGPAGPARLREEHDMANLTGPKGRPTKAREARATQARRAKVRARRLRYAVIGGGVAVVIAVVAFAVTAAGSGGSGVTDPARFDLPALNGPGRVQLTALHGKPVVVNLFASWCTTCEAELLGAKVTFVGVNSVETGNGCGMAERFGLAAAGFTLAKDVGGANNSGYHDALGANGMPATAFYDANGHLIDVELSGLPASVLRQKIQ